MLLLKVWQIQIYSHVELIIVIIICFSIHNNLFITLYFINELSHYQNQKERNITAKRTWVITRWNSDGKLNFPLFLHSWFG